MLFYYDDTPKNYKFPIEFIQDQKFIVYVNQQADTLYYSMRSDTLVLRYGEYPKYGFDEYVNDEKHRGKFIGLE